jgi:hypothetical protein
LLQTAERIERANGRIEGSFAAPEGWSVMPIDPGTRQLRIFLGDPLSGPLIWLFNGAPVATPHPPAPHLHRTPTFRIALGDQPRQMRLNNSWYGRGDYFLLDANKVYTDPNGIEGFQTLLMFADRRGLHPVRRDTAGMDSDALVALNEAKFTPFGGGLSALHTRDEDAIAGAAITTHDALQHGNQLRGSIHDCASWRRLSDGSMIAAALMGDAVTGPAVIMSENVPNAVESPAGRCGVDMLRVIASGSCTIGKRSYAAGSFLALEAGAPVEDVVHGPEGSTQLLVLSDRRFLAPVDADGVPVTSLRISEMASVLEA